MKEFEAYIQDRKENIVECVDNLKCQPILFAGSGLSIRYFSGPSWESLLETMANNCPEAPLFHRLLPTT